VGIRGVDGEWRGVGYLRGWMRTIEMYDDEVSA